ncbi:hypothetical protein AWB69_07875 [Caballeronia udeis]|uniref:Uncharacterized protein n=1 Tax=Caballeronia udeis TaxID=1232866 RepID=A0A158JG64_9BURK|nr:hypothetical protein AWB69_07875 [Caballeronia udeis]
MLVRLGGSSTSDLLPDFCTNNVLNFDDVPLILDKTSEINYLFRCGACTIPKKNAPNAGISLTPPAQFVYNRG